jgi:RluA family pseudouridine synthase
MSEPATIFTHLVARFPEAKKTTLRDMLAAGRVTINGVTAKSLKHPVTETDAVAVLDAAEASASSARSTQLAEGLRLVHFDTDVILVEKPAGLLTATDAQEKRPTVWRILTAWFRKQNSKNQVHLIHRLDRDASGLLVFARTWEAYTSLKEQFFEHTITRRYDVIAHGVPKQKAGRLENLLLEDEHTGVVRVTKDLKAGKLAILDYELRAADRGKRLSHLQCTLFTGRKHQIRVQLKAAGHPVCGDPVYGKADEPPGRLALHASHLAFAHPRSKKRVTFDAPMPGSFAHLIRQ